MIVRVHFFALAKQRVGRSEISIELPPNSAVADLRAHLAEQFPALADLLPQVRLALNAEYVSDETLLSENCEAAIIPPVSGG